MRRLLVALSAVTLPVFLLAMMPLVALAQQAAPIPNPPGFAEVRARFENLTAAQVAAMGYVAEPVCVASPAGGMGIHAIHPTLWNAQYNSAEMDPQNPPIVLLSGDMTRVVGLEWEAKDIGQGSETLWGQNVPLLPGHPGVMEPHYMLHAYFRSGGQVLFAEFDPAFSCPAVPSTATASQDGSAVLPLIAALAAITTLAALSAVGRSSALRRARRR